MLRLLVTAGDWRGAALLSCAAGDGTRGRRRARLAGAPTRMDLEEGRCSRCCAGLRAHCLHRPLAVPWADGTHLAVDEVQWGALVKMQHWWLARKQTL